MHSNSGVILNSMLKGVRYFSPKTRVIELKRIMRHVVQALSPGKTMFKLLKLFYFKNLRGKEITFFLVSYFNINSSYSHVKKVFHMSAPTFLTEIEVYSHLCLTFHAVIEIIWFASFSQNT